MCRHGRKDKTTRGVSPTCTYKRIHYSKFNLSMTGRHESFPVRSSARNLTTTVLPFFGGGSPILCSLYLINEYNLGRYFASINQCDISNYSERRLTRRFGRRRNSTAWDHFSFSTETGHKCGPIANFAKSSIIRSSSSLRYHEVNRKEVSKRRGCFIQEFK